MLDASVLVTVNPNGEKKKSTPRRLARYSIVISPYRNVLMTLSSMCIKQVFRHISLCNRNCRLPSTSVMFVIIFFLFRDKSLSYVVMFVYIFPL